MPGPTNRNRILILLFFGVLMGALGIAIIAPALPAIQKHFGIDDRAKAWVFGAYVLFNLIGTPLMAKLSDARGRRAIYILDVSLFALGSLVAAVSPAFGILMLGRALQGLGAGGIFPVASAVIGDTFPPEKRGSALGLIGAVFGLAFLLGPILGGVILSLADWRWLFIINLPIAAGLILASLRLLPRARPAVRKPFDLVGMALLALGLASFAYGINQIDTNQFFASLTSTAVWPFLVAAVLLFLAFWRVELRAADPILRLRLFASRQIAVVSGVALGAGVGESAVVFVPSLLVAAFSISAAQSSWWLLPPVLAMAVGSPFAGRMLDRAGSRAVVATGSALLAAGMLVVGLSTVTTGVYLITALLVGLGLGMLLGAPLRYIVLNEAPLSDRASAQGGLTLFTASGQLIGSAVVGAVAASGGGGVAGYQSAFLAVGGLSILLFLLALRLKSQTAERETVRRNELVGVGSREEGVGSRE